MGPEINVGRAELIASHTQIVAHGISASCFEVKVHHRQNTLESLLVEMAMFEL